MVMTYSYPSDDAWKLTVPQPRRVKDIDYIDNLFWDSKALAKERASREGRDVSKYFLDAEKWCLVSKGAIDKDVYDGMLPRSENEKDIESVFSRMKKNGMKLDTDCTSDCSVPGSSTSCAIVIDDPRMDVSRVSFFGKSRN